MDTAPNRMIELQFQMDGDAPPNYRHKWNALKDHEDRDLLNTIIDLWRRECKLDSNMNLPILDRVEGGLGGNNNRTDKQLRFVPSRHIPFCNHADTIIINVLQSDDKQSK